MINQLAVTFDSQNVTMKAERIATRLHIPIIQDAKNCIWVSDDGVYLKALGFSPMRPDFNAQTWQKRRQEGKKQGLVRAIKPQPGLTIVDATAGWGKDAAILASFGASVLMVERNPVMGLLLEEALCDASLNHQIQLHLGSSIQYLKALQPLNYPDVIYLDPMHPERNKSAKVKKEMQMLQELIGPDEDVASLIAIACTRVKQRVVVKWPAKTAAVIPAHASIAGKTVRFDVYAPTIVSA